jgi:hypothetical protein
LECEPSRYRFDEVLAVKNLKQCAQYNDMSRELLFELRVCERSRFSLFGAIDIALVGLHVVVDCHQYLDMGSFEMIEGASPDLSCP